MPVEEALAVIMESEAATQKESPDERVTKLRRRPCARAFGGGLRVCPFQIIGSPQTCWSSSRRQTEGTGLAERSPNAAIDKSRIPE